jgi:hypothetical protein
MQSSDFQSENAIPVAIAHPDDVEALHTNDCASDLQSAEPLMLQPDEGFICIPALILQSPPENEELPFDMLVAGLPTFQWLNSILSTLGLNIKNVRIINVFPFITENWLKSLKPADQEKELRESLDLTIEFFKTYQPETVISCQCLTQKPPEWLRPIVYHPLVQSLSSNVENARTRAIKFVQQLYGRTINVIQGFHPSYILRAPKETYRNDRHHILSSLLTELIRPVNCGGNGKLSRVWGICYHNSRNQLPI